MRLRMGFYAGAIIIRNTQSSQTTFCAIESWTDQCSWIVEAARNVRQKRFLTGPSRALSNGQDQKSRGHKQRPGTRSWLLYLL
jgi:hypothetical protein